MQFGKDPKTQQLSRQTGISPAHIGYILAAGTTTDPNVYEALQPDTHNEDETLEALGMGEKVVSMKDVPGHTYFHS